MCAKTTLLLIISVLAQDAEVGSVKLLDSGVKKLYKGVRKKKNGVARSSFPHLNFFHKHPIGLLHRQYFFNFAVTEKFSRHDKERITTRR